MLYIRPQSKKWMQNAFFACLCLYLKQKIGNIPYGEIATMLNALATSDPDNAKTEQALRQQLRRFEREHDPDYNRLEQAVGEHPDDLRLHLHAILHFRENL